jgi:hypothetical protein
VDSIGSVYGFSRKGEIRFKFKEKLPVNGIDWFIDVGKDLSRTNIISFDPSEKKQIKLSLNGKVNEMAIESELNPSSWLYANVNDDAIPDLILIDETGFEVFDDHGVKILSYTSKENLIPELEVFEYNKSVYFILTESQNNLSKILSSDLKILPKSEVNSSVLLQCVKLSENQERYLVVRNGKRVLCYPFNLN